MTSDSFFGARKVLARRARPLCGGKSPPASEEARTQALARGVNIGKANGTRPSPFWL
jgi:hypothetical protein